MRFARLECYDPITFTERKAAAFARRQRRERDALPLFADQVAAKQTDWETEQMRRQELARQCEKGMRDLEAKHWRQARADYFAMNAKQRAACISEWNAWKGPRKATSFAYVVSKHNGVYEARRERCLAELRAMNARIQARLQASPQLDL